MPQDENIMEIPSQWKNPNLGVTKSILSMKILKFRETEKERLVRFTDIEEIELVSDDYH